MNKDFEEFLTTQLSDLIIDQANTRTLLIKMNNKLERINANIMRFIDKDVEVYEDD